MFRGQVATRVSISPPVAQRTRDGRRIRDFWRDRKARKRREPVWPAGPSQRLSGLNWSLVWIIPTRILRPNQGSGRFRVDVESLHGPVEGSGERESVPVGGWAFSTCCFLAGMYPVEGALRVDEIETKMAIIGESARDR